LFKGKPNYEKQRFFITSKAPGNRNVFLSKQKDGEGWVLKLRKPNPASAWRAWFIMDKRTGTVRHFTQRHLAISNQMGKGNKKGKPAVLRAYDKTDRSQQLTFNGDRFQSHAKNCLSTQNGENKDNVELTFWTCNGKPTQKWVRNVQRTPYDSLCEKFKQDGGLYLRCPGKKDKLIKKLCKKVVKETKSGEVLYEVCGKDETEIAKCHRVTTKSGKKLRRCGSKFEEEVDSDSDSEDDSETEQEDEKKPEKDDGEGEEEGSDSNDDN